MNKIGLRILVTGIALSIGSVMAAPLGTAFTYQGQLSDAGLPATGAYDLQFKLFDAATAGAQVGSTVLKNDVAVASGQFTVSLDFGPTPFAGQSRFLEIGVRPGASSDAYTLLGFRQELTPSPNALFATSAASATTVAGLTCTNNQVAKWSGSAWTCGADVNSGGTVTSVAAGAGLAGGPITGAGALSVATGGITSGMIADGAVGSAQIANGAVGSAQVNTAQVQTRVTSACPPGLTIQTINPDGTVVCQTASAQAGFSTTTLDSVNNVGAYTSMAIGVDGLGLISYSDNTFSNLKVAHCSNSACTAATISTLDSPGQVGAHTSIAIGADGLGLISYHDVTNGNLKVAHCVDTVCSTAGIATLDSVDSVGQYTSIAIGADGLGLISYYDDTNDDLKVAHCSNLACSTASIATLDSVGNVGRFTSIAIGADGLGLISYNDATEADLKVAHCSNAACSTATTAIVDSAGGQETAIAIGADGLGLISYLRGGLSVAHCSDTACSTASTSIIDNTVGTLIGTAITIGADGLGLISYRGNTIGMAVAHCSNAACSTATTATIDSTGSSGFYPSVARGADGLGLVSYHDAGNGDLRVAHCPNVECRPALTSVAGGAGLVSGGTQGSTATLSVDFAGTGVATTVARSDHNHDAAYSALGHNHDAAYSPLSHDHFGQSWSGTAQTVFGLAGSNTGGSWFNLGNTSAGGKTWNLITTGSGNGEGVGKLLFRSNNDSSVVMALDAATAPWVGIGTSSRTAGRQIETSSGGYLTTGGAWTNSSDRNLKENLVPVAADDVLARLAKLPVYRWNYRAEPDSLTHIGPTAQDFEAAFGLGGDGRSISTIDPSGIALAAIQELNRRTSELADVSKRLDAKQSQVDQLRAEHQAEIAALMQRLMALEQLTSKDARTDVKDRR